MPKETVQRKNKFDPRCPFGNIDSMLKLKHTGEPGPSIQLKRTPMGWIVFHDAHPELDQSLFEALRISSVKGKPSGSGQACLVLPVVDSIGGLDKTITIIGYLRVAVKDASWSVQRISYLHVGIPSCIFQRPAEITEM